MIDFTGFAHPKPRPRVLEKDDRKRKQEAEDRRGSEEARKRANGRCEIEVIGEPVCTKPGMHTHHMIGGRGRRGIGESAKAERKQRACADHHEAVTHGLIRRVGGVLPHYTDRYERIYC